MLFRVPRSRILGRFLRNECGAATIEAVLWLPFFILLFGVLVDVSMIFNGQSRLLRVVQDANRNMSIGRLATTTDTQNFVLARVNSFAPNSQVSTTYIAGTGLISTAVTVPISDLDLFGAATVFNGVNMVVSAEHLMEN